MGPIVPLHAHGIFASTGRRIRSFVTSTTATSSGTRVRTIRSSPV
jgi:hypothetical protein